MIRSVVSCRVVYSSLRKPQNSDPVVLATTRSFSPETTQARRSAPRPSTVTTVVRVSVPARTKECSCGAPSISMRSQKYSSISIRAPVAFGVWWMKWSPRVKPNSSMEFTPFSLAKANTVFFWVSVGRIAD